MNNIRIYISGPMAGVENYKENFAKAAEILVARGYDVVNPALLDDVITGLSREAALKLDLDLLEECDTVVLLPGWEQSCGANREYGYAMAREMNIIDWEFWLKIDEQQSGKKGDRD